MSDLDIIIGGHPTRVGAGASVTLGRDASSTVPIASPVVSRAHARLEPTPDGWLLVDLGSTQGTWHAGERVTSLPVSGALTVTLGTGPRSVRVDLAPVGAQRPGGGLRENVVAGTEVAADELAVECGGRSVRMLAGRAYRIGRAEDNDIVSTNPTVSRYHGAIEHVDGGWVYVDGGSARGSYFEGARVDRLALPGTTVLLLGDPQAGERLVTSGSGERIVPPAPLWKRVWQTHRAVAMAAAAALVLVLALGGWAIGRAVVGPADADLDLLARATVRISHEGGSGSGTIIDAKEGLILTNAHVAAPSAPGRGVRRAEFAAELSPNPTTLRIAVAEGRDKPAVEMFTGQVVAADGFVDLAIVQITGLIGGGDLAPALSRLSVVDVGDSDALRSGDGVWAVGFPGISDSKAATYTKGVISGTVRTKRITSGPYTFNSDVRVNAGNSGGLGADRYSRIVAVPSLVKSDKSNMLSGLIPVNLAKPLIAAARAKQPYTSQYTFPVGDGKLASLRLAAPGASPGLSGTCGAESSSVPKDSVTLNLSYENFPNVAHTDLLARVINSPDGKGDIIGEVDSGDQWPYVLSGSGCVAITIPLSDPINEKGFAVLVGVGPNHERTYSLKLTRS